VRETRKFGFVFFDHGGTLTRQRKDSPQIVLEVLAESGLSFTLEQVRDALEEADRYWEVRYKPLPRGQRFNDNIIEDLHRKSLIHLGLERGVDELARKIASEWHERAGFVLHPDTLPCLEALRQHGMPMGIITQTLWMNSGAFTLEGKASSTTSMWSSPAKASDTTSLTKGSTLRP
jgi:FMN phosphatase YigB (HAD superfamily)